MIDLLLLRIPFKSKYILQTQSHAEEGGKYGLFVDLLEICQLSDTPVGARTVEFCIDGDLQVKDLSHPFESLPSSFASLAVKIHSGSTTIKPCVEIKASPAKLLQCHNVFGSEDLELCAFELLGGLASGRPKLYDLLDIDKTSLDWIDITYSAHVQNEVIAQQVIDALKNTRSGQTKKTLFNKEYQTTVEWNSKSQYKTLKAYLKGFEVDHQIIELEKELKASPNNQLLIRKHNILTNPDIRNWAKKCVRFEARLKHGYLSKHGIPRNLFDAINYKNEYEKDGKNLLQDLWKKAFKDILDAIQGAEMNIYDDKKIKEQLRIAYFTLTPKGNISYSKADRIYSFYRSLLNDGYQFVKNSMARMTFFRYEKELLAIGISKMQLQNLQQHKTNSVPLCRVIEIDFSAQRPSWYVEPQSFYSESANQFYLSAVDGAEINSKPHFNKRELEEVKVNRAFEKLSASWAMSGDASLNPFRQTG